MGKPLKAIEPFEIKYKGQFDFKVLYQLMYFWFYENGYKDEIDGKTDKIEHLYFQKENPGGKGQEIWYWWRVKKSESPFFTYHIKIEVHVLGKQGRETIIEGKKIPTGFQEASIFFNSEVTYEEGKFDFSKNWITSMWRDFFFGSVHKKQLEDKKNELYGATHQLINVVKQHLGLMMDVPLTRPFHNPFGTPQLR